MNTIKNRECKRHGNTEFYLTSQQKWVCKKCRSQFTIAYRQKVKLKCIEYKGGKCERCGYNKCVYALDFHHLNLKEKDFNISKKSYLSWDKIKAELDKCILVCANCHREIHFENGGNHSMK